MATKAKDGHGTLGKEKARGTSPSNSHLSDTTPRKRSPKNSRSGSPADKPTPNYLKPTISSQLDSCKHGKKPVSPDTASRPTLNRRKSFDKSPLTSGVQKAVVSQTPKDRTFRSLPISSRNTASPKSSVSERLSKPSSTGGKSQAAAAKPKSTLKKSSSPVRKEPNTNAAADRVPNSLPHDVTDNVPNVESEHEDQEALVYAVEEEIAHVGRKEVLSEVTALENNEHADHVNGEQPRNADEEIIVQPSDPASVSKEQTSASQDAGIEEAKEKTNGGETVSPHEVEENNTKDEADENHAEESFAEEPQAEAGDKAEDVATEDLNAENGEKEVSVEESGAENKLGESSSQQRETLGEKEEVDEGLTERLKFKAREEVEGGAGEAKAEAENVVLKRQGAQGKKDSPAYNDVIEETAGKLLEKRRNKVKALVGAFETVISLQEPEA
ncbi:uncharacterized protein LOC131151090 [Malania oleifera]|uniref:uncharacterized protein LOC131151090 n=1 Tax=Malania oleifera TaxID=397392 RepID=UPI0025ADD4FA|nr:uncharacterized protein LOC131151090 [Malania oleifera]